MPRCADGRAAGRVLVLTLPAALAVVVVAASPALAHGGHETAVAPGPAWVPIVAALVGGWFLADPRRRRQPLAAAAGVALLVAPSWPDLLRAGHLAGAGLWAGAAVSVLRRPSKAALQ